MKQVITLLVILIVSGCGWTSQCTKMRVYELGSEREVSVGTAMVQTGCFESSHIPWGIHSVLGRPHEADDGFQPIIEKEILYSGREGSILHIMYREYTWNGYARSPFFQQVYYDMKSSDSIVFQDWAIKVLDSNNEHIRFKVIKDNPHFDNKSIPTPHSI